MDLNLKFGKLINMKKAGKARYAPGVELGRNGRVLKLAQGDLLKATTMLAMTGAMAMLIVTIGFKLSYLWQQSPVLIFLGNITALVFLLISQVATFFWYLITGMSWPMNAIANALPAGSVKLQTSVCFFPVTLTALVIGLRTYMRIYVSKKSAYITLSVCIGLIALCVFILYQA
ncbi:MAG: hypothetical protein AB1814_02075 [Thermodesulfobacteriota bacterium]